MGLQMEVERDDARICRDRCLQAVAETDDTLTGQALWRAAMRYHQRADTLLNEVAAEALRASALP
jgi:hypothetical protein